MALWPFSPSSASTADVPPPSPQTDASNAPKPGDPKKTGERLDEEQPTEGEAALKALTALLEPFMREALPANARTKPDLPQKEKEPMTITKLWRYIPFFTSQGTSLTKAFINHHLFGPPKPSWGIEMTLFTAFLREAAAYSHLSSLARLRAVLDLGAFLPTPKDGIVTPISFPVKRRGLRGFLAQADAEEDGKRLVTGEWVINKRLWKKMQMEFATNNVVGKDRVILYLHGGAYYVMSAETHRFLTISVSRYTESRVFAINYRLAPETRFPGQLHDAVSAYMRLIVDLQIPPENIVFAGDSAGGGLCLATMMYLRDEGYPLPSGAILQSPWIDLTMSCESWTTNQPYDYLPMPGPDDHLNPVKCLLGPDNISKYLTHPYVSPLFGNFAGLPPLLIQAGDAEVLRDEITLLAHKASLAGVIVEHEIFEDCVHVFQIFLFLDASRKALQSQRQFVKYRLPTLHKLSECNVAQMDAEITADAHPVDSKGNAELVSLPSSPLAYGNKELSSPEPNESDEDEEADERLSSDSEHSTARDSPIPEEHEQDPLATLPTPSPVDELSSSSMSSSISNYTRRPILRAYASARDLLMSKTPSSPDPSSSSTPFPSLPNGEKRRHHRSKTISVRMESREDVGRRPLHARSSSHPDFQALLESYTTLGPSNDTKVYSAPPPSSSASASAIRKSRSRAPSIVAESPGSST